MALAELVMYTAVGGAGSGAMACGMVWLSNMRDKLAKKRAAEKTEAEKIDGRSPKEWYEIIKGLGREEYERLSRGALDGLEESDKYGKWDIKPLLKDHYDLLMQDWYPEKYCKYCQKQNCKQKCDAYWAGVPRCKLCYDYVEHGQCVSCGTSAWNRGTIRTKSERAKEVEYQIDQALGVIKIKKPQMQYDIPKPPPRAAIKTGISKDKNYVQLTPGGMAIFTKHDIKIADFGYHGVTEKGYRITRDDESWIAGVNEIGAFQTRKGLQPTGKLDHKSREALIRYLDAGNPWPVAHPGRKNLTVSELERVNRDLAKWKKSYEGS